MTNANSRILSLNSLRRRFLRASPGGVHRLSASTCLPSYDLASPSLWLIKNLLAARTWRAACDVSGTCEQPRAGSPAAGN